MEVELFEAIKRGLVFYLILAASVCVHEWAHAYMADKLGDPLPAAQGRVTLNPFAHLDMVGTVIFPLLVIFGPILFGGMGGIALIGWGKPVQISLPNRKTRMRDDLLITAAGPLSNLGICLLLAVVGGLVLGHVPKELYDLFKYGVFINAALFTFNLIPIPPLDGSHFLKYAINMSEESYMRLSQYGFIILIVMINISVVRNTLFFVIDKVTQPFVGLIHMLASI